MINFSASTANYHPIVLDKMSLASGLLSWYTNLSLYALAFILKSTNNRGHVTDGTPHHPTFPQASNVIGSGRNHVSHTYSFIHKRASLAALDGPTFSQSSSLKKIPRLLPMMPFQHVVVPQDEKPQLYHWLGFASLVGFFSSSFFLFLTCGRFPRFTLGSDSKR